MVRGEMVRGEVGTRTRVRTLQAPPGETVRARVPYRDIPEWYAGHGARGSGTRGQLVRVRGCVRFKRRPGKNGTLGVQLWKPRVSLGLSIGVPNVPMSVPGTL